MKINVVLMGHVHSNQVFFFSFIILFVMSLSFMIVPPDLLYLYSSNAEHFTVTGSGLYPHTAHISFPRFLPIIIARNRNLPDVVYFYLLQSTIRWGDQSELLSWSQDFSPDVLSFDILY